MSHAGPARDPARLAPLVTFAVVLAVTLAVQPAQPVGTFWDEGLYLITARALAPWQWLVSAHTGELATFFPVGVRPARPLLVVLVLVLVLLGVHAAWRRSRAFCLSPFGVRFAAGSLVTVAVMAGAGLAFYSGRGISRGLVDIAQRTNARQLQPVVDWVNRHTSPADVVACDGDPFVHLHTGRHVVPIHELSADEYIAGTPLGNVEDDLRALRAASGAHYAVFSGGTPEIRAARMLGEPRGSPRLVPIDTLPGGGMAFRVEGRSGSNAPPDPAPQLQRSRLR